MNCENVIKKRGRKSKKQIEIEKLNINNKVEPHIIFKIEEKEQENNCNNNDDNNDDNVNNCQVENNIENEKYDNNILNKEIKKRGRKPKGGKIIKQIVNLNENKQIKPNIILHLKCFIKDLNNDNVLNSNLEPFVFLNSNNLSYDIINTKNTNINDYNYSNEPNNQNNQNNQNENNSEQDIKEIWKKLKILQNSLHKNNLQNNKSSCFWDTCTFDNPPIYIPKNYINDTYEVYGCFCSPECAVAYLMQENIDTSIKFERYQLIHHIYSKIYNYSKHIKPSPSPYYMLEKYYGNLTIQQFRSLLKNDRLFLVVDKPLTRVMPELHEDNDDFIINNKIIPTNNVKYKKQSQTKINILNENFGLAN